MARMASAYLAAAIVCAAAAMSPGSAARAQSPDLQARCAVDAEAAFENLRRESSDVLQSLNVRFDVAANDYQAHYSSRAGRCLLLIRKTASVMGTSLDMSYLIAAGDRQMYALYIDADGKMDTCALIPSIRETRSCKDRNEYNAFVAIYMERKQGGR